MATHFTLCSKSASSKTIAGLLPPSSRVTRFRFERPALSMMCLPTSVLPVNAILRTRRWSTSACPAVFPYPFTMLNTPGGKPASRTSLANLSADSGVSSDGFRTTVQPVASAGAIFMTARLTE